MAMLFKQDIHLAVKGIILTSFLALLAGCSNSAALEGFVSADPRLKEEESTDITPAKSSLDSSTIINPEESATSSLEESEEVDRDLNSVRDEQTIGDDSEELEEVEDTVSQVSDLPFNFPGSFPVYPQAHLEEIKSEDSNSGMLVWNTTDNRKAVADYYQAELLANDWKIIKPFTIDPEQKIASSIAVKDDLRLDLNLFSTEHTETEGKLTHLAVIYHSLGQNIANGNARGKNSGSRESKLEPDNNRQPQQDTATPTESTKVTSSTNTSNSDRFSLPEADFIDLDDVPEQLQQPLKSIAALGILTPYTGQANVELSRFAPNQVITRGEYARWLIAANNRYYSDNPSKKIYIVSKTDQPAFKDVNANHPDFAAIQSLAEAGLIPSRLTEDSTSLLFRPDAPLTREDLITWKVPFDTRQSLPKASLEAIEESWGFQDAANINSSAVRALYADFQNGDFSNVRRIFGYTTLFQPKKPVTRAEAAASLWYFGFQGDGITAREILESEAESNS
jgi:hypothetical protein